MHVHNDTRQDERGLTLVELLIGVAIIGILVAIAVPGFTAYRHKSRVAVVVSTAGGIRSALASYAADHPRHRYPLTAQIGDWQTLRTIINANGGALEANAAEMAIEAVTYTSDDGSTYMLQMTVGVPEGVPGRLVSITPASISKD